MYKAKGSDNVLETFDELDQCIYYKINLKRNILKRLGLYLGQPAILRIVSQAPRNCSKGARKKSWNHSPYAYGYPNEASEKWICRDKK